MSNNLNVVMAEEDWVRVLNLLAEAPFKQVAPIINQMQSQLHRQMETAKQQEEMPQSSMQQPLPQRINGKDNSAEHPAPGA